MGGWGVPIGVQLLVPRNLIVNSITKLTKSVFMLD